MVCSSRRNRFGIPLRFPGGRNLFMTKLARVIKNGRVEIFLLFWYIDRCYFKREFGRKRTSSPPKDAEVSWIALGEWRLSSQRVEIRLASLRASSDAGNIKGEFSKSFFSSTHEKWSQSFHSLKMHYKLGQVGAMFGARTALHGLL